MPALRARELIIDLGTGKRSPGAAAYRERFRDAHSVFVVVHVTDVDQALRNTRIARDAGATGVFLINHGIAASSLQEIWAVVTLAEPGFWVGVNDLSRSYLDIARSYPVDLPGVWSDHCVWASDGPDHVGARDVRRKQQNLAQPPLLFGGVAFKYGRDEHLRGEGLAALAGQARELVDVITTSGSGTGCAANLEKIATMRGAIGDYPLAIASGITPENVADYLPHADAFLVATGISTTFDEIDPVATAALVARVQAG